MRIPVRTLMVLVLALSAFTTTTAVAHVELFESDPPAGGTTREGDRDISMTFISLDPTEPIKVGVTDEDGVNHVAGTPRIRPPDRGTEVVVPVRPLALGEYTVEWTAVSDDGDTATGSYTFSVVGSTDSGATWVFWIGGALVLVAITAVLVRTSRRSR